MAENICILMKKGGGGSSGYEIVLDSSNPTAAYNYAASVTSYTLTSDPMPQGRYLVIAQSFDITSNIPQARGCTLTTTGTVVESYAPSWTYAIVDLPTNGTVTGTSVTGTARGRSVCLTLFKLD